MITKYESSRVKQSVIPNPLTPEERCKIDAYWRAANYLSVGQIYLYANPLLKEPLTTHISSRACWATGARRPD